MANKIKTRSELKLYFVKNAIPTEGNFADLIDSQLNQSDDGVFKPAGEPLSVVADSGIQKRVLRFYSNYSAANPTNPDWLISLNPAQNPADPATNKPGFGIADGAGNTRLFIHPGTGNVGVGTNTPADKLAVQDGDVRIEGGRYRRLKIVSDKYWAGIELVTREQGEAGNPHIDFTHGQLDAPNYGIRVAATSNTNLSIVAGEGTAVLDVSGNLAYSGTQNKLDVAEQNAATVRVADFRIGHSGRRGANPGRALVDNASSLVVNYGADWARTEIHSPLGVNGNLGANTTNPEFPLDIRLPAGAGTWNRFVVTTSTAWGDGANQHVIIGAGGAAGIMFWNPHVTWYAPENRASIRYGRTAGTAGNTWWDGGVRADGAFSFNANDNGGVGETLKITKTGELSVKGVVRAPSGVQVDGDLTAHINTDGAFYRYQGQVYLTVDDNLYIRDSGGAIHMHFQTDTGVLKTSILQLGDKWRMSGIGDVQANDDWLRLFDTGNRDYYGGLAAGRLWSRSGTLSGSDLQLKTGIQPLHGVLDKLIALRGIRFQWKQRANASEHEIGLIAQEVEKVFPELVAAGPDDVKGIKYNGLIALLLEAIKEQQRQIEAMQQTLRAPQRAME